MRNLLQPGHPPETGVSSPPILIIGATGCIGGALLAPLLATGAQVRVLARNPGKLPPSVRGSIEVVPGDAQSSSVLRRALRGVRCVYYLMHTLDHSSRCLAAIEVPLVRRLVRYSAESGVERIVHLGALAPQHEDLSAHLASRREIARILVDGEVPAFVLRTAMVIAPGSASFLLLRHSVEKQAVVIGGRWLTARLQPVAVADVLHYLTAAAELPRTVNGAYELGGPEVLSYLEMIQRYAALVGRSPRVVRVETGRVPEFLGFLVGRRSGVSPRVAGHLLSSLGFDMVVGEQSLSEVLAPPSGGLTAFDEAVRAARAAA